MRRLALLATFSCVACSLVTDLTNLGTDASLPTDAPTEAPVEGGPAYTFSDDFNRADSGTIGNGWIEKNPAFVIASGRAVRANQSTLDFRDLVVYRPASEAYLDVTASVEVVLSANDGGSGSWEQLHVRVQPSTVGVANALDGYIMFAENGGKSAVTIARARLQAAYVVLATFQLSTPMVVNTTYRFTLQVKGTNPVMLFGSLERNDAPSWTLLGSTSTSDVDTTMAVVTPGVVGFSASIVDPTGAYAYDNFVASGN